MSSRRRSSRLGGANLEPTPSLDDVLVENRKRSRRTSSSSNKEIEDKSTALISEVSIVPIVEENVELNSENKVGDKIESKSAEVPSITLKRAREEEIIDVESAKRAKIETDSVSPDLEKVNAEKSPEEPVLLETQSSEVKELLPPALKRPREEEDENIPLDSAKKAKLDYTEEKTLEQNINPNSSISNTTDSINVVDDEKNQNVKTSENPGRESAEVRVKGRVCKSGRFWKSERDRFRSVIKSKGLKQNFKLEMKRKEDLKRVKAYEQSLKDSVKKEKEDLRARQEENKKKRDENQRKAEVYQEVMNLEL